MKSAHPASTFVLVAVVATVAFIAYGILAPKVDEKKAPQP